MENGAGLHLGGVRGNKRQEISRLRHVLRCFIGLTKGALILNWSKLFWRRKKTSLPEHLNICLVAARFPVLGRSSDHGFLWPLARGLVRKGHEVTVISSKSRLGKAEVVRDGVRVFYLHEGFPNMSQMPFPKAVLEKFRQLHREKAFDLVHSFDRSAFLIGKNRHALQVAVTYDVEATQMSQLFSILGMARETVGSLLSTAVAVAYKFLSTFFGGDHELLSTADGMFVTSPQQRIFLERYYLYPDFHIYGVPYGIEVNTPNPTVESIAQLRQKYNLPENAHIVVTVTDMAVPAEMTTLLHAFERVAVKKPSTYLVIIGTGEHWFEIEHEMLGLALNSRVIMTGALREEEISEWISIAEVFANLSSRHTGFEPTMIEAMAKKKVIIGSELSPMANMIEDGQEGFLLRPADMDSLAQLLVELFSGSLPAFEIGQKARDKVNNLFDPQKMIDALDDSYRRVLSN
ncbi:MAG: glycosyltransferase [Bdellovibrio sp.]|nr:MAG: glycosyltransferase [Bdellovibrio sp.]